MFWLRKITDKLWPLSYRRCHNVTVSVRLPCVSPAVEFPDGERDALNDVNVT